jgi:hypothetical protein
MRQAKPITAFVGVLAATAWPWSGAIAHHSFAVHFVPDEIIAISGVVEEFRFRNPHGVVTLTAVSEDGRETLWRAETNSPNILRRRGWTADSIPIGAQVVIEGYPARDGSHSMRIYRVILGGGELVGQRPNIQPTDGDAD